MWDVTAQGGEKTKVFGESLAKATSQPALKRQGQQPNSSSGMSLMPSSKEILVNSDEEANEEVAHNVAVFSKLGLIGWFRGLWPSLQELHTWISDNWEPMLAGGVQIYPATKGFFITAFEKIKDRNKILCENVWCWEEKYALMLKPWHTSFCPNSEVFDKIPIWVRLPNLPLHLWSDSCLEVIGDTMGSFLMVDEDSSNLYHSTYACILVDRDISEGLQAEITIKTSKGCWVQTLNYEGIPFRCKKCFQIGHMAAMCNKVNAQKKASWCKRCCSTTLYVDTVEKKGEKQKCFSQVVTGERTLKPTGSILQAVQPVIQSKTTMLKAVDRNLQPSSGAVTPESREKCRPLPSHAPEVTSGVDDQPQQEDSDTEDLMQSPNVGWENEAARVEDGWHTVRRKKVRKANDVSFDMILQSHTKGRGNVKDQ